MSEGRCKNCRWWSEPHGGWGICAKAKNYGSEPLNPPSLAVVTDFTYQGEDLKTQAEFGCSQFERKTDE